MVIKIYISGISGNKEVKKRQRRVLMILDSKNIKYEEVDIAEPGNEDAKEFMQNNAKSLGATVGDANPRFPLPPQVFNDEDYCGDYDAFDLANEMDEIEKFLKLAASDESVVTSSVELKLGNGEINTESEKVTTVENENENEAEAKKDDSNVEEAPSEDVAPSNDKPNEEEEEGEEKGEEEKEQEETVTSETKIESTTGDTDIKLENGNAENDSLTTDATEVEA